MSIMLKAVILQSHLYLNKYSCLLSFAYIHAKISPTSVCPLALCHLKRVTSNNLSLGPMFLIGIQSFCVLEQADTDS